MLETKNIYTHSTLRVCVDMANQGEFSGLLYGVCLSSPKPFSDFGNLLLLVDGILDQQDFPRAFQRKRVFCKRGKTPEIQVQGSGMDRETVLNARGKLYTFEIRIFSRQNATWQGEVNWLDGSPALTFFSALDLIRMVDARNKNYYNGK